MKSFSIQRGDVNSVDEEDSEPFISPEEKHSAYRRHVEQQHGGYSSSPYNMHHQLKDRKKKNPSYGNTESHQYEQEESEIWWHHQLQR